MNLEGGSERGGSSNGQGHLVSEVEFDATRAAGYDEEVSEYEIYDGFALAPFLDRVAHAGPELTALDLGCGTGAVTVQLVERGFTTYAVDVSSSMIAVAKRKVARTGRGELATFHVSDAGSLPFPDGQFDLVTCQRVLHHIPDIRPVFAEIERVLKPGGLLYLSDVVADSTPAGRALRSLWGSVLRRSEKRAAQHEGRSLPADGDGRELHRPANEFRSLLAGGGFSYRLRFFTHVGLERHLSTGQRSLAIKVLSAPWKNRGDVLFVYAVKPA